MSLSFAVETNDLKKSFGSTEIIHTCHMHVKEGTIYGFLGENGAGKTTVFKMLAGIIRPTTGSIRIFGLDIITQRTEVLKQIGTLIETPVFYEHLSAVDNLKLHLSYMGATGLDPQTVLNIVGLTDTGKRAVSRFSLGMRQRLAIARAISHQPRLLILDEPINGLDPAGIKEMRELFSNLVQKNHMTILLSSHILSEMEQTADTIGFITKGTLIEETPLSDLQEKYPAGLEKYFMEKREEHYDKII